jgi:hypothetical protein
MRELAGLLASMRQLAGQIIKTFAGIPRAGLTQDNAYVHSMHRRSATDAAGACSGAAPPAAYRVRLYGMPRPFACRLRGDAKGRRWAAGPATAAFGAAPRVEVAPSRRRLC